MKTEPDRLGTAGVDVPQRVQAPARGTLPPDAPSVPGLVEVSNDARRVQPEVRLEKVERARELLASGELGADHQKLASAMIDDLLEQP